MPIESPKDIRFDADDKPIQLPSLRTINAMSHLADEFYKAYFSNGPLVFDGKNFKRILWKREEIDGGQEGALITEIDEDSLALGDPPIEVVTPELEVIKMGELIIESNVNQSQGLSIDPLSPNSSSEDTFQDANSESSTDDEM